jgi:plasmid stabilization system protein ParE
MAVKIRWTRKAVEDRISILSYLLEMGADFSVIHRLDHAFMSIVNRISRHPEMGRLFPNRPFRYVVFKTYMIVYIAETAGVIVILQIWDTRQDPDRFTK